METSLHRSLKERYATGEGSGLEVGVHGYRIDAVDESGRLIEVQSAALGPLRGKLRTLLPSYCVRVVKPVVLRRTVVHRKRRDGPDLSARLSPKRGSLLDVFDDLIGLVRVFPHANLEIDVLGVTIDEVRIARRRRPGYAVLDRRLGEIQASVRLSRAEDLWALLPSIPSDTEPFTTKELAARLERSLAFSQRVAYCLRLTGAARVVGKSGNHLIYMRDDCGATAENLEQRWPVAV
jgi:hypothetical protein